LDVDQKLFESLEVICLVFLIDVVSGHVGGIQGIEPHAALKAGACFVGDEAKHLDFLNEIVDALVDVSKPVDLSAGQMGSGRHQILVLRPKGEFVSKGGGIDMGLKSRMLGDVFHTFPVVIDYVMKVLEALDVIFLGNDSFHSSLLLARLVITPNYALLSVKMPAVWSSFWQTTSVAFLIKSGQPFDQVFKIIFSEDRLRGRLKLT